MAQDVIVSGSVKGRVTVDSGGDVVLGGSDQPVTPGTDVIGLVAADNLVFAGWATNANFTLEAAVITEGSNSNAYNPSGNSPGEFETYNQSGSASMTWTGSAMDFTGGDMVGSRAAATTTTRPSVPAAAVVAVHRAALRSHALPRAPADLA